MIFLSSPLKKLKNRMFRTLALCLVAMSAVALVPGTTAFTIIHHARGLGGLKSVSVQRSTSLYATTDEDQKLSVLEIPKETTESATAVNGEKLDEAEELSKTQVLMKQVKEAGLAGIISYAAWELAFWAVSVPVVVFGYNTAFGHFPDFSNSDDLAKLGAEAFAFVNFARLAVPLRIGLALSTTPWIQKNVVETFKLDKKDEKDNTTTTE